MYCFISHFNFFKVVVEVEEEEVVVVVVVIKVGNMVGMVDMAVGMVVMMTGEVMVMEVMVVGMVAVMAIHLIMHMDQHLEGVVGVVVVVGINLTKVSFTCIVFI